MDATSSYRHVRHCLLSAKTAGSRTNSCRMPEAALKEAKTSGEKYLHHRLEMNAVLAEQVRMENRLRTALRMGNSSYTISQATLQTGRIEGAEALLRWRDPEQGLLAPGAFLPLLESAGPHARGYWWVLSQVTADCGDWRRRGLPAVESR